MPQAQPIFNPEENQQQLQKKLHSSLDKLQKRSQKYASQKYGISDDFLQEVNTESQAMQLCEKAMETLATEYVDKLIAFKEAKDPVGALEALESSEVIWMAEASIVSHFDQEGGEKQFLGQIRQGTLRVLENRLEESAALCSRTPSPENIALCLGVMGVMDSIWESFGEPTDSPMRRRFREIAKSFQ